MFIKKKHDIHDQVMKYNIFTVTLNNISIRHFVGLMWTFGRFGNNLKTSGSNLNVRGNAFLIQNLSFVNEGTKRTS